METVVYRSSSTTRESEGRSFLPKIRQKHNTIKAQTFGDHRHLKITSGGAGNEILSLRQPMSILDELISSSSMKNTIRVNDSIDAVGNGIRHENTLHCPKSHDPNDPDSNGPLLISSFPLPRVNGLAPILELIGPHHTKLDSGTQTKDYDLTKIHLPDITEHRVWREKVGGPFIEMLRNEIIKNKPCDLEDFVISVCEARLQCRDVPETAVGHKGGDSKLVRKNILKIVRKESTVVEVINRRGSVESGDFVPGNKRGSFTGTPLIDYSAQKRASISQFGILNRNRFSLSAADSMHKMEIIPSDTTPSSTPSRRNSVSSTTSSVDSAND